MNDDDSRIPFTPTLFGGCFLCAARGAALAEALKAVREAA